MGQGKSLQRKSREFDENFAQVRDLSGNFMNMVKLLHKDATLNKVMESFDELFLIERLQVVSCCDTPLLIS